VDEEWRVSVAFRGPAGGEPASARAVSELLRGRVGEGVAVTAGKAGVVFLYAAAADAAAGAEGVAREVLARKGLAADIRLDRWDPARQAWVPPGDEADGGLPGQEPDPGRKGLRTAGAVIVAIVEGLGSA
jgi:hypothetical protein